MALPTLPVATALLSGVTTRLWLATPVGTFSAASRVPLTQEIDFSPTGSVQSIQLFGEIFDRAVKTGIGGTLNFKILAKATDPVATLILAAAYSTDAAAQMKFVVVNPDLKGYSGYLVIETAKPTYDNRNVFGYEVSATLDGQFTPFTFTEADIPAT